MEKIQVGCVIMASGLGRRFGSNKLLADFNGQPLIHNILELTGGTLFAARVVVTRHEEVAALCRASDIPVILHDLPNRNDTVRLGLEFLTKNNPALSGCMFCPSDQPLLRRSTLESLLFLHKENPDCICRPCGNGSPDSPPVPGTPVLFARRYFPELLCLPEGKGGGFLAKKYPEQVRYVPVRDMYELMDADTPDDLFRLAAHRLSD